MNQIRQFNLVPIRGIQERAVAEEDNGPPNFDLFKKC